MIFPDQDLLNIAFSTNKYLQLDKKYNCGFQNPYTENSDIIYHYYGTMKPWHFSPDLKTNILNYTDIWWKYAEKTGYIENIKTNCKYKDQISLRVARATKAYQMLNKLNVKYLYEKINK